VKKQFPSTTIYFIRHGEVFNPQSIFYGRLPRFTLSVEGNNQVARIIPYFANKNIYRVFSSPLLRARKTAEIIQAGINHTPIEISALLNEVHSPYDGFPISDLESKHWVIYSNISSEYEQPEDIFKRVLKFANKIQNLYKGKEIIAVTHADVIVFLTLWIHGYKPEYKNKALIEKKSIAIPFPGNASITKTVWSEGCMTPQYEYISADEV